MPCACCTLGTRDGRCLNVSFLVPSSVEMSKLPTSGCKPRSERGALETLSLLGLEATVRNCHFQHILPEHLQNISSPPENQVMTHMTETTYHTI
ncbi:hypothetical protein llap_12970 [Limosa lapponica baueri]|uniref:Uncharacterized protein n=1 Tax=Limosa lapponica baueri TaxID=1758121 RepID=A0A2I0TSH1_LIMLA|nr:hypothetical protein llap_12970 [Limosa lapponica baueri]